MNQRMNLGYMINDSIRIGDTEFVIGYNPKSVLSYAVWECINENYYYWGQYFSDRVLAERELLRRAMNACDRQDRFLGV